MQNSRDINGKLYYNQCQLRRLFNPYVCSYRFDVYGQIANCSLSICALDSTHTSSQATSQNVPTVRQYRTSSPICLSFLYDVCVFVVKKTPHTPLTQCTRWLDEAWATHIVAPTIFAWREFRVERASCTRPDCASPCSTVCVLCGRKNSPHSLNSVSSVVKKKLCASVPRW